MPPVNVRYIVDDVQAATAFYADLLGFGVEMQMGPGFAVLSRGDLHLLLTPSDAASAGAPSSDDGPRPGGWNRIQLAVDGLDALLQGLSDAGVKLRGGVVEEGGGRLAVVDDPSGNPVELFEKAK